MKGDHEFRKKPKGSKAGGYARPRVQIGFSPEQMKIISDLAKQDNQSFAAEVRELIDLGIKSIERLKKAAQ